MLEIWELITGRKQHKIGKDGGNFLRKPRPDKGCGATDDDLPFSIFLKVYPYFGFNKYTGTTKFPL
jgi:hypothetical protein